MKDGLRSPAGAWVLMLLYVVVGAASFGDDRFLNDEGLLTHLFAALLERDFVPAFFLQKTRPPISLLYAPAAAAGVGPFLWMHLCISALAVPLVAATARTLGHQRPNVAAAVVALSPMFIAGGAAGLSNADAVVGLSLVLWLWSSRRLLLAGFVLGTLVWVRAELLVFVAMMLGWAAWHRNLKPVLGLALWPLAYGLAGAAYHAYLPWMFHYPPALTESMPDNPFWHERHRVAGVTQLAGVAVAVSPAIALLICARPRRWSALERWWSAAAAAFVFALVVLPRWQVFNFDESPRYLMPILPVVALLVGRATEHWHRAERRDVVSLVALAVVATVVDRAGGSLVLAWATLGVAVAMAIAGSGRPRASVVVLLTLLSVGPRHFADAARIDRHSQAAALEEMFQRIAELTIDGPRPIVTNEPIVAAYAARSGRLPELSVHYLVQADQVFELTGLTNPANGQRERIFAALAQGMYGTPIFPEALVSEPMSLDAVPRDALVVTTHDPRLELVLPATRRDRELTVVSHSARVTVAERRSR